MHMGRGWLGFTIIFVFHSFFGTIGNAASKKPRLITEFADFTPGQKEDQVRSKIEFLDGGQTRKISIADLSVPDAVSGCPVDTMPMELSLMISQLTNKVGALVQKMADDQADHCSALSSRLKATQSQVGTAFQYRLVAGGPITSGASQDIINQQTQQASAVNQMILTTSDILQNCVSRETLGDQQVIQKLIAQIVTLTGLFMGGWQGIAIATGGQIIGAIPLFTGDLENALKQFKRFDQMGERGSFLCYLRQIRKTSCLLFANEDDQFINGLDLSFNTGPVHTTIESIEKFKKEAPQAVSDLEMLRKIKAQSDDFMTTFTQIEAQANRVNNPNLSPLLKATLDQMNAFCHEVAPLHDLSDPRIFNEVIQTEIREMSKVCSHETQLISLSFSQISNFYWQIYSLSSFYQEIIKDESTEIGKIGRTIESMKYFEGLKKSVTQYADSNAGNQNRMQFLDLSRQLSKKLGVSTFKKLFKDDFEKFLRSESMIQGCYYSDAAHEPSEHGDVRGRALRAMIDLCMTFDPTLTCMDVGNPKKDPLFKTWIQHCVGPESNLCRDSLRRRERAIFLKDQRYRTYFDSLCGPEEKIEPDLRLPPGLPNQESAPGAIHAG